jgi:hypothetical protein
MRRNLLGIAASKRSATPCITRIAEAKARERRGQYVSAHFDHRDACRSTGRRLAVGRCRGKLESALPSNGARGPKSGPGKTAPRH